MPIEDAVTPSVAVMVIVIMLGLAVVIRLVTRRQMYIQGDDPPDEVQLSEETRIRLAAAWSAGAWEAGVVGGLVAGILIWLATGSPGSGVGVGTVVGVIVAIVFAWI